MRCVCNRATRKGGHGLAYQKHSFLLVGMCC